MADEPGMIAERPLPEVTPLTEPFWSAAKSHKLVIQRCDDCQGWQFPPEVACTLCGSPNIGWAQAGGRASLYTWTVAHPPLLPYFQEHAPWPVVAVQLEEGPRMISNLVDAPIEDYRMGMPLEVTFKDIEDGITLVLFRRRHD